MPLQRDVVWQAYASAFKQCKYTTHLAGRELQSNCLHLAFTDRRGDGPLRLAQPTTVQLRCSRVNITYTGTVCTITVHVQDEWTLGHDGLWCVVPREMAPCDQIEVNVEWGDDDCETTEIAPPQMNNGRPGAACTKGKRCSARSRPLW